jgi:hypothetical protein
VGGCVENDTAKAKPGQQRQVDTQGRVYEHQRTAMEGRRVFMLVGALLLLLHSNGRWVGVSVGRCGKHAYACMSFVLICMFVGSLRRGGVITRTVILPAYLLIAGTR